MRSRRKTMLSALAIGLCASILLSSEITVVAATAYNGLNEQDGNVNEETIGSIFSKESANMPKARIIAEIENERSEYVKRFRMNDGSFMAVQYEIPVHYLDSEGKWVDYDNRLDSNTDDGAEVFDNRSSNLDIKLSKKSKENNMVKIKSDDYMISWGYVNAEKVNGTIIADDSAGELTENEKFTDLQNVTSEVVYYDIFDDVDIQYIVSSLGVKENIILGSEKAQRSFEVKYKVNNLNAQQIDDKTISLIDKNGDTVYTIKAPFMTDADGDVNTDVTVSIKEQKGSNLTVEFKAADTFFDENCSYPVVIDPTIYTVQSNSSTIESTYANKNYPNTCYGGTGDKIYTGHMDDTCYSFIKMNNLPSLKPGDIITESALRLNICGENNWYLVNENYINAYEITQEWSSSTLTWNNKPSHSETVSDYVSLSSGTSGGTPEWDITGITKKWYNNPSANYGVMLKHSEQINTSEYVAFYSHNAGSSLLRPQFLITYRNSKGLEDYWTYTSFSVGTAGTAYINDYTGNLVFVHNDASIAGNNGFTLQHIFNNSASDGTGNDLPYTGNGWRLNIQQTVKNTSTLLGIDTNKYPAIYTDGDGTEHYFVKYIDEEVTHYYDEDGLGLELVINSNSSLARYEISDVGDNKMSFDANGNLRKIEDSNGNLVTVNRTNYGKITSVTTQNSNSTSLRTINIYSSDSHYIQGTTDSANRVTHYYYTNNRLVLIVNPDATSVKFSYDSDGSISSIEDIDGYKVSFSYTTLSTGKAVSSVQEFGTDNTEGQKITFERSLFNTTTVRTSGVDNVYGTDDDVFSVYQFDNYGRTISVKSTANGENLGASGVSYTGGTPQDGADSGNTNNTNNINNNINNIKNLNRVSKQHYSSLGTHNYIKDGNMEVENCPNWTKSAYGGSNTFTAEQSDEQYYFGKYSYKITSTAYTSGSRARIYQDINSSIIQPGKTYTLSAYVKVTDLASSDTNYGAEIAAASIDSNSVATFYYSELLNYITDTEVDNGWRRLHVTFTVPANSIKTRINLYLRSATGTVYFDGVQLEEGETYNKFNIIENASFENRDNNSMPISWTSNNTNSNDICDSTTKQDLSYSYKFTADPMIEKTLTQEVNVVGSENDTYILSGWIKSDRIKSGVLNTIDLDSSEMITARIVYSDGTSFLKYIDMFNDCLSDWQFGSGAFDLSDDNTSVNKTPEKIVITLRSAYQANDCYFDNIQLIKDNVQMYSYDDGNLVGYSQNAQEQSVMEYDSNSNLIKTTDSEGYETNYAYDNEHNITEAASQTGVTTNYTYDSNGNVITTSTADNNENDDYQIKTETSYTSDGLFVSQVTDEDGNAVNYTYDTNKGNLTSVTDSNGTTNYTYDSDNDLPLTASKNGVTLTYGYTNGTNRNLTSIGNGYVSYSLNYDKFNNVQQTKVGSNTLSTYTYGSSNGSLNRLSYGNGDYIDYLYDNYGSVSEVKQNGQTVFEWLTDNSGTAVRHIDSVANREYNYNYDTAGRIVDETIKSDNNGSIALPFAKVNYAYDPSGRVSTLINSAGKRTVTVDYAYQQDSLPSTVKIDNDKTEYFTYDSLNRLTSTRIDLNNDVITSYTYKASDRNTGSSQVYQTSKIETENIGGNLKYKYTYDASGNITGIYRFQNGPYVVQNLYEYDSFNQLKKDTDYVNLTRTDYTYDNHGNITQVVTYSINSNGTVLSTLETKNYQYSDSSWKDKLTIYDGNMITYDAIGNPLTYRGGMTMTWQNGRELAALTDANNSISYTYDADGLRTTKTVNSIVSKYEYVNGQLLYETRGAKKIHYIYDSFGNVMAAVYKHSSAENEQIYYYARNWRGDIVALYNSNGNLHARYEYDAWGKLLSIKNASGADITNTGNFAIVNPFRYRGYYYDTESGLYYLQSRYYDPTTGRFVNADSFKYLGASGDIIGYNLFEYCENNPVIKIDSDGSFGIITWVIIGVTVGVTVGAVGGAHYAKHKMNLSPNDGWNYWQYVVGFGAVGGIIGEFFGLGAGIITTYAVRLSNSALRIASNAAYKAAGRAKNFNVSTKHLSYAKGNFAKFNTSSKSQVQSWVSQALKSRNALFFPNKQPNSYYIITDMGRIIGTKGERFIKVVFDVAGKIWTAFPVKNI